MSAIGTRLRCGSPLSDLNKLTLMFETLELQNLNKLIEGKVRDFASPQAFHAVKIQGLGGDEVEPLAKVCSKFAVPVFALVYNMPIQSRKGTHSTPPVVRTFDFTRKAFVECSEFLQGLFQKLWGVYLFASVECQVSIHTEIYAYALTCSSKGFGCGIVSYDIKPIGSNSIAKDLDITDVARPIAVMVIQDVSTGKYELLFACVPFLEGQTDSPFREFVARLELRRAVASFAFKLRQPTESAEKTLVGSIQANNHRVNGVARYPSPVFLCAFQQLREMRLQPIPSSVFPIDAVITLLELQEVVMHITKVVQHIAQTFVLGMFAYLIFLCSQGLSRITSLTPDQDGLGTDTPCDVLGRVPNAIVISYYILDTKSNVFEALVLSKRADFPPLPKGKGFPIR